MPLLPLRPSRRRLRADRTPPTRDRTPRPIGIHELLLIAAVLTAGAVWAGRAALATAAPRPPAAATRLAAPRLAGPAGAAEVSTVPGFSWRPVRRAAKYEFQLA